jgi:hypothetical protein
MAKEKIGSDDHQEILDTIYSYSYTYDGKDTDAFLALFTEDCIWEAYDNAGANLLVSITSRAELDAFVRPRLAEQAAADLRPRHFQTNPLMIGLDHDRVEAITMINIMWQYPDNPVPVPEGIGVYKDEFVKTKNGWKFAVRRLYYDSQTPETRMVSA